MNNETRRIPARMVVQGLLFLCAAGRTAICSPSTVERVSDLAWMARDDNGSWSNGSMGNTHQLHPDYCAKKILDLENLPEDAWTKTRTARVSIFFCVRDYSVASPKTKPDGLDEAMDVVVNGHVHRHETRSGLPVYVENKSMTEAMRWHDFAIPKEHLTHGLNEIIVRKSASPDKLEDDYIYLGIDRGVPPRNSFVILGKGGQWRQDRLNVPGGVGEYMVRLYLLQGDAALSASWQPHDNQLDDAHSFIQYAGSHGDSWQIEWDPMRLDPLAPLTAIADAGTSAELSVRWLDEAGELKSPPMKLRGERAELRLPAPLDFKPSGLRFAGRPPLRRLTISASLNYHPLPRKTDIAPPITQPKGRATPRPAACRITADRITLENASLRCEFSKGRTLRFASLENGLADTQVLRQPEQCALFLLDVAGKRYAGSSDFICADIMPAGHDGFTASLRCQEIGLRALFHCRAGDSLQMGLELFNESEQPVDMKVAFPHLSGLAISDSPADDYYFFPWGGGIISDSPALLRRGYGDHEALYQMVDLFSPSRGAGLAIRCLDVDGRHKVIALRKHIRGQQEVDGDRCYLRTADEYKWTNSLAAIEGTSVAFEYLRRTRGPGQALKLKDVAIEAHAGDWHAAMRAYADWCHRVWRFRPYPSRLEGIVNMIAAGWGKSVLFKDGGYRTDFIRPMTDCIELMSWWDWSPLGPWSTPFDRLHEVLSPATLKRWESYFVPDPVTGKKMWNNQPGDYDGYNQRFGGLPAFRQAIETYRSLGAMPTLYTDPFRMDDASKIGRAHGKEWGVVEANGKHSTAYEVWNPCHDCPDVRRWVADTMGRVMRETGADGIRLDEYGHRGWACFSTLHEHTFAEPGCTEWQRAVSEATEMIRAAMDEARPGSVLTTEHPGYDYLMQHIEGCITYDLTVQASPLRPLECNTQRFYFPECRAYELDHRGADKKDRKKFWNAVASFGRYYPEAMYRVLHENADAFGARGSQPLVPTLARFVYANRFESGEKLVLTLFNATGHSFEGPTISIDAPPGTHVFDLLSNREADAAGGSIRLFMPRDDVACIARLPDIIRSTRDRDGIRLDLSKNPGGSIVRLCDSNGKTLEDMPITGNAVTLVPNEKTAKATCAKLIRDGILLDAEPLTKDP